MPRTCATRTTRRFSAWRTTFFDWSLHTGGFRRPATPARGFPQTETFADQAGIAIENVRLFEAEKQHALALAHANRVITMGHLAASIAHEVNQPTAAIVANAHAALRWLDARLPDLGEVRQALNGIVADGNRTGEVIARIRGLINKVPPRRDPLDMNQAISDATT